jgi:hypothetical protein
VATILDHLRAHLIAAGVGRDPRIAGDAPPIWRQRANTPAPGEGANVIEQGKDAVVNLLELDGIPTRRFDIARRRDLVEVRIRSFSWPRVVQIGAQIRAATIDRTNFPMGAITVIEAEEWTALGLTDATEMSGGQTLYSARQGVVFETYADSWGL